MSAFKIRVTEVRDLRVVAKDSEQALRIAHDNYSFDGSIYDRITAGLQFEVETVEAPLCRVDDGGPCRAYAVEYDQKSQTLICEKHKKTMVGGAIPEPVSPIPAAEIPF